MSKETLEDKVDDIHKSESFFHKYVFQILTLVFLAGGGWMTLSTREDAVADNETKIEQNQQEAKDTKERLITLETNQKYIAEDVKETKEITQQILEELRRQRDEN